MKTLIRIPGRRIAASAFAAVMLIAYVLSLRAQAGEMTTFFHNDIAGSPMLATDINGLQIWKATYRPYGDRLVQSGASQSNDLWFTGKPFDDSTGLSYFGARYYDPTLGRFTGVDPVRVKPFDIHSFNRYSYANNNPYKYVDPDGREVRQQTHLVLGTFNHTKITIIPNNQQKYANDKNFIGHPTLPDGRLYATLGAGPQGGSLVGEPNRKTDRDFTRNTSDQLLKLPEGKTEDEVIAELFERDAAYDAYEEDVDYALFPSSLADGYNSNSYALGLLLATGFQNIKVPPMTAGYQKTLDDSYFVRPTRGSVTVTDCTAGRCGN